MVQGDKGYQLEELLRAYFLRWGFFVVRSVPFQHAGEDLTDIDLWLYERPTGSSRRRQIVDAKSKTRPKAMERLLWTTGLVKLLEVDGAYVATTDTRPMLRGISKKLGISVFDGADIKRIGESDKVIYPDRIAEEELLQKIIGVDRVRRTKELQLQYRDAKIALIENFGAKTINRALESFRLFAVAAVTAHPGSEGAEIALRLSYFASSVVALALDYVSSELSFRASDERRAALINAVRLGHTDETVGTEGIRLAVALVHKYAAGGDAIARSIEVGVKKDLKDIPAEIIADHIVRNVKQDDLFQIARRLENVAFLRTVNAFDGLGIEEKAYVAMLLDYSGIDRVRFASCWSADAERPTANSQGKNGGPLFSIIGKDQNERSN